MVGFNYYYYRDVHEDTGMPNIMVINGHTYQCSSISFDVGIKTFDVAVGSTHTTPSYHFIYLGTLPTSVCIHARS